MNDKRVNINIVTTLGAPEVKIKLTIMNPIELAESRCHDLWKANSVEFPFPANFEFNYENFFCEVNKLNIFMQL